MNKNLANRNQPRRANGQFGSWGGGEARTGADRGSTRTMSGGDRATVSHIRKSFESGDQDDGIVKTLNSQGINMTREQYDGNPEQRAALRSLFANKYEQTYRPQKTLGRYDTLTVDGPKTSVRPAPSNHGAGRILSGYAATRMHDG